MEIGVEATKVVVALFILLFGSVSQTTAQEARTRLEPGRRVSIHEDA